MSSAVADLGGLRLAYSEWPGNSPPILLLHGLASNRRIWDLLAPRLSPSFRVLALDQRGHGESDKPDRGYDFATVAADLEAFLRSAGIERPILVGHSWGAGVALAYAAERPSGLAALALVDGACLDFQATGLSWEEVERMLTPPPLAGMPRQDFLARIRGGPLADLWSPEIERIAMANFEVDAQDRISPRLSLDRHMQVVRALWEQRPPQLYPRLTCPTLLILARRPPQDERAAFLLDCKQAVATEAERLNPLVTVQWMDDTIHDIPLQRPQELAQTIATLAQPRR